MAAKGIKIAALLALLVGLALAQGCAAHYTAAQYQYLDVGTHLSNTVFLEPRPPALRTVYVEVRNATEHNFNIAPELAAALAQRGYRLAADPASAQIRLQVLVLNVSGGRFDALQNAPGMAQAGVIGGAAAGALAGGPRYGLAGALIGGLAMGMAETAAGASTQVFSYSATADIQIAEVARGYEHMGEAGLRRHYLRATTTARQLNLPFETAQPYLRSGLIQAVSGLF